MVVKRLVIRLEEPNLSYLKTLSALQVVFLLHIPGPARSSWIHSDPELKRAVRNLI